VKILNSISLRIILQRLLISLGVILFIRVGSFLPIPGINHTDLALYIQNNPFARNIVSTFSGKDTFVIGLFTLNIFPYINASIFIQLIIAFSPALSKLQKEGDLNARRSLNRLTRFVTLVWAIIQSVGLGIYLRPILFNWNTQLLFEIVVWLTTGAMIVLWLSELVTDYGLGNGASLLIYTNIVSSFPNLCKTLINENLQNLTLPAIIIISSLILLSLCGIVLLQEGVRRIPIISSKQLNQRRLGSSNIVNNYIPVRLNQAGVMPIILTTTVLVLPGYISNLGLFPPLNLPISNISFIGKISYWVFYFGLILLFSSFYSTIVLNPKDIADQLQKMAVTIQGIRPGVQTTFYLKKVMNRLTVLGAVILALLATLPNIIEVILQISSLNGLSTTSLLIMAGVLVDISKEVDDIIYSNIYKKKYI
jgi:preprotein translocase subunit SecY